MVSKNLKCIPTVTKTFKFLYFWGIHFKIGSSICLKARGEEANFIMILGNISKNVSLGPRFLSQMEVPSWN